MTWLVDDINLSNFAFNIANRSAGWSVPARRGDNLTIPGRHGTQWVANKPFDEGATTLSMWAIGANEDGSMPDDGNQRRLCRYNLDKLTAIFGQTSKLLNVVQVEGLAYGVQNIVANPAFEKADASSYYTYQNSIQNPAGRATASGTLLTNVFSNPNMAALSSWQQSYENLVTDPTFQYQRATPDIIGASNYFWPSSFETTPSGSVPAHFSSDSAVTMEVVGATATDQAQQPYGGAYVLRCTTTASVPATTNICNRPDPFYVASGVVPSISFMLRRSANSSTGTRTIKVRIFSYADDSSNDASARSNYSDYQTFTVPASTSTWTRITFVPTGGSWASGSPTNYIGFQIQNNETWASGTAICFDQFVCNVPSHVTNAAYQPSGYWGNQPGPFWNAASAWGNLTGSGESGLSRWNTNPDDRWVPDAATNANSAYYTFAEMPSTHVPGVSLNFVAMGFTAGQTQGFETPLASPTAGHMYALRFQARAAASKKCTVKVMRQASGSSTRDTVASVTFTGSGTPVAGGSRMSGTIIDYESSTYYTAQAGDKLWMRVEVPTGTDGFPILQFENLHFQDCAPWYFTGGTTDSSNTQYSWAGTAYNSKSVVKKQRVARLTDSYTQAGVAQTAGGVAYNIAQSSAAADGQTLQLVTEDITLPANQGLWVAVNAWCEFSSYVNSAPTQKAIARVELLDNSGQVLSTVNSATTTLAAPGSPKQLVVQITPDAIPSGVAAFRVSLIENSAVKAGCRLDLLNLLVMPFAADPTQVGGPAYFDGSTSGAAWVSTANNSNSIYKASLPSKWSASPGMLLSGSPVQASSPRMGSGITPQVVLQTPLSSAHSAGQYQVGVKLTPQALDASGAVLGAADVQVMVQALDSTGAVQGTVSAGMLNASTDATGKDQYLQGMLVAAGAFTNLALWVIGDNAATVVQLKVSQVFLMPCSTTYTNPVQRIDFNAVYNPQFVCGTDGWTTGGNTGGAGTTTLVSTARGQGYALTGTGRVAHRPAYLGDAGAARAITYAVWARQTKTDPVAIQLRTGPVRTNLYDDPRLSRPGDMSSGGTAPKTVDTSWAQFGASSLKVGAGTTTASGAYPFAGRDAIGGPMWEAGQTYTASVYVRLLQAQTGDLSGAARALQIGTVDTAGNTNYSFATSGQAPNAAGVTRVSVTFTVPVSGFTRVFARLLNGSTTTDVWFSNLLVEKTGTLGGYFDGTTGAASGTKRWWDGTTDASRSREFVYNGVTADLDTVTQTSYTQAQVGQFTLPATATHAELVLSGDGAEISSVYLGLPSGATTDLVHIDPDWFPYFDGASTVGPFGESTAWTGTANSSVSRATPTPVKGWGSATSPSSAYVQQVNGTDYGPPGWYSGDVYRPSTSDNNYGVIPRNVTLNSAKVYKMTPVDALDNAFISGSIAVRKPVGPRVLLECMQADSPTGTGVTVWSQTLSEKYSYNSARPFQDVPITKRYVYLQVTYTELEHAPGFRMALDNVMLLPTATALGVDFPGYFDGDTNGASWDGTADDSTSSYFGGGRRAYAEVRDAVDMTSMAGGTRAEFSINLAIPGAFWEDLLESNVSLSATNAQLLAGTQFEMSDLAEGTAPIDDALITVKPTGTVTGLVLTDVATGATLSLSGTVPSAGVVFDCGAFTAVSGSTSVIKNVTRAGSNGFLPLTPRSSTVAPTLGIKASGSGSLAVTVVARRRYLIA